MTGLLQGRVVNVSQYWCWSFPLCKKRCKWSL